MGGTKCCTQKVSILHVFCTKRLSDHHHSTQGAPRALRRRHAQTVRDRFSSYQIDYVIVILNFLNPEGHQNPISCSKVMVVLLKGWVLLIGGAALERVCACSLRSRFFLTACIEG